MVTERVAARYMITARVAARALAAVDMPQPGNWTVRQLEEWHAQTPKPRSAYDRIPEDLRPFTWSTPAPVIEGEMPAPWRVAHADHALALLKKKFPTFKDIYVDYGDGSFNGRQQLWVGLRDNRDREGHAARMQELAEGMEQAGLKTRIQRQGQRVVVHLIDDLPKDVLKG